MFNELKDVVEEDLRKMKLKQQLDYLITWGKVSERVITLGHVILCKRLLDQ